MLTNFVQLGKAQIGILETADPAFTAAAEKGVNKE